MQYIAQNGRDVFRAISETVENSILILSKKNMSIVSGNSKSAPQMANFKVQYVPPIH